MLLRCTCILLFLNIISVSTENKICALTEKCDCINVTSSGQFEFHCPPDDIGSKAIIHVYPLTKKLTIDCSENTEILDSSILPETNFQSTTKIIMQKCPLPENGFSEILNSFNISNLEVLSFTYKTSNDTLKYKHFEGLNTLKTLDLKNNHIKFLNTTILKIFSNLTDLLLDDNEVQLRDDIFEFVPNLRFLSLPSNKINYIPKNTFSKLTKLERLYLWGNNLSTFESGTFAPLKNLKLLELSLNKIQTLEDDIFDGLDSLVNLSLRRNKIEKISRRTFENCHELEMIKIDENSNLYLVDDIFSNFPRLHSVYLGMNGLKTISETLFEGSTNLKSIMLSNNKLKNLPRDIFQKLENLEELCLANNKLETLDASIFSSLVKLEILHLENNKLSELDAMLLKDLKNLKEINLSYNNIARVDTQFLSRNKNIIKFSMSHNRYDFEEPKIVSENTPFSSYSCRNLKEVDLSYNQISRYPYDLHSSAQMREINLASNSIDEINLEGLISLNADGTDVNLESNNIFVVNFPEFLDANDSLPTTTLKLSNNPINCDCHALDLVNVLKGGSHPVLKFLTIEFDRFACSSPKKMERTTLEKLKLEDLTCSLDKKCTENEKCECEFRSFDKTMIVNCLSRNLTVVPKLRIEEFSKEHENIAFNQTEVHLEWNKLNRVPEQFEGFENVTRLHLQGNNISNITWLPPSIKVLDLRYNAIQNLDQWALNVLNGTDADELHLGNNPWKCNCGTENVVNFLTNHSKQVDMHDIRCKLTNRRLIDMQESEFYPKPKNHLAAFIIGSLCFFLILTAAASFYYKYQKEILVWLYARGYCLWLVKEEELDKDKKYDAFISFSHCDENFVFEDIISVLESGEQPYKLCVHVRDWIPGEFIQNQITSSVLDSRRTIVVLSKSFLESVWGKMEFRAAHTEAMKERRARVILIIYGDVNMEDLDDELKLYMKTNTYIKWGDPWFWEKLKYALPKRIPRRGGISKKHANMMKYIDGKFNVIQKQPSTIVTLDAKNLDEKSLTCVA